MRLVSRFRRDQSGVAAVEMALVAPVIAGLAFVSFSVWEAAQRQQNMEQAMRVAQQYYLTGGLLDDNAKTAALAAWQDRPATATFDISRVYRCGDAGVSDASLCSSSLPPSVYAKIDASASNPESAFQPKQARTQYVRLR